MIVKTAGTLTTFITTWATEHRMVASFFFKAGYVENLRWTVAGESVVMFHHAFC